MRDAEFDEHATAEQVARSLRDRFPDVDPAEVDRVAAEQVHSLADAPVKDYVDVLAERESRGILRDASHAGD
jgi:hypothetical protein